MATAQKINHIQSAKCLPFCILTAGYDTKAL